MNIADTCILHILRINVQRNLRHYRFLPTVDHIDINSIIASIINGFNGISIIMKASNLYVYESINLKADTCLQIHHFQKRYRTMCQ